MNKSIFLNKGLHIKNNSVLIIIFFILLLLGNIENIFAQFVGNYPLNGFSISGENKIGETKDECLWTFYESRRTIIVIFNNEKRDYSENENIHSTYEFNNFRFMTCYQPNNGGYEVYTEVFFYDSVIINNQKIEEYRCTLTWNENGIKIFDIIDKQNNNIITQIIIGRK
jgi:hypothetical protein